jgi:hypothetical protein
LENLEEQKKLLERKRERNEKIQPIVEESALPKELKKFPLIQIVEKLIQAGKKLKISISFKELPSEGNSCLQTVFRELTEGEDVAKNVRQFVKSLDQDDDEEAQSRARAFLEILTSEETGLGEILEEAANPKPAMMRQLRLAVSRSTSKPIVRRIMKRALSNVSPLKFGNSPGTPDRKAKASRKSTGYTDFSLISPTEKGAVQKSSPGTPDRKARASRKSTGYADFLLISPTEKGAVQKSSPVTPDRKARASRKSTGTISLSLASPTEGGGVQNPSPVLIRMGSRRNRRRSAVFERARAVFELEQNKLDNE